MKEQEQGNKAQALEVEVAKVLEYYQKHAVGINQMMEFEYVGCQEEKNEVTLRFPIKEWQLNPNQILHGGVMATCFDMSYGLLTRCVSRKQQIATVNISVSYLRPVQASEAVVVVSRVTHLGRTMVHLVGEAFVGDRLVASSTATFMILT